MVVHRIPLHRAAHRVVGSEGDEAFPHVEPAGAGGGREHQLVHVGMGVAAIHVALTPIAGSELAVRHGPAFEIRRRVE